MFIYMLQRLPSTHTAAVQVTALPLILIIDSSASQVNHK